MPTKKIEIPKVPENAVYATGRRKESTAKVWIFPGSGNVYMNKQPVLDYIKREILCTIMKQPLVELNLDKKYDVLITGVGGGLSGQAGAARMGIARALVELDANFRSPLKKIGVLTRDSRMKERKKYGRRGARKGAQFRKR